LRISGFEWDAGNAIHLALGHGIEIDEAEEVFAVKPLFRKTKKGHYICMGSTLGGRYLTLVFELKSKQIARVITGWDMTNAERKYYRKRIRR